MIDLNPTEGKLSSPELTRILDDILGIVPECNDYWGYCKSMNRDRGDAIDARLHKNPACLKLNDNPKITRLLESIYGKRISKRQAELAVSATRRFRPLQLENNILRDSDDSELIDLANRGDAVFDRLCNCSADNPCQILACPQCAHRLAAMSIERYADIIAHQEQSRKSIAYNFVVSSSSWRCLPGSINRIVLDQIQHVSESIRAVLGYRGHLLYVDAIPVKSDRDLSNEFAKSTSSVTRAHINNSTMWNVHAHGILMLNTNHTSSTIASDFHECLFLSGIDSLEPDIRKLMRPDFYKAWKHSWLKKFGKIYLTEIPNKIDKTTKQKILAEQVISSEDIHRTLAYNCKMTMGANLPAEHVRVLQRSFVGVQTSFVGGLFTCEKKHLTSSVNGWSSHKYGYFGINEAELSDRVINLQTALNTLLAFVKLESPENYEHIRNLRSKIRENTVNLKRVLDRVIRTKRFQRHRRRVAVRQMKQTYRGDRRKQELETYFARCRRNKVEFPVIHAIDDPASQQLHIQADTLRQQLIAVFEFCVKLLSRQPQIADHLFCCQLDGDNQSFDELAYLAKLKTKNPLKWFKQRRKTDRIERIILSLAAAKSFIDNARADYIQTGNLETKSTLSHWQRVYPAWSDLETQAAPKHSQHLLNWEDLVLSFISDS